MSKLQHATPADIPDTDTPTFYLTATYRGAEQTPQFIELRAYLPTSAQAATLAGQFPVSARVKVSELHWGHTKDNAVTGTVRASVDLVASKANQGVNETGLRRYRTIRRHLERLGCPVVYSVDWSNCYPTEAAFEAALV